MRSLGRARGSTSRSRMLAGIGEPSSWVTTSSSRSRPPREPPTPCQVGRKRASASAGTGSISRRSRASDRRRSARSTSGSAYSCSEAPGRKAPSRRRPRRRAAPARSATAVGRQAPARSGRCGRERRVGPRPALEQARQRRVARREQGLRHAARRAGAERVAVAGDVLDRDPALLARDAERDRAARALERVERDGNVESGTARAATSPGSRSPTRRRRSWSAVGRAAPAGRSASHCSSSSSSAIASGSSSSRSSSSPSSSRKQVAVERRAPARVARRAARRPRT